jgi:hypothetical protein
MLALNYDILLRRLDSCSIKLGGSIYSHVLINWGFNLNRVELLSFIDADVFVNWILDN